MTRTIASVTKELIVANPTMKNADILALLQKEFPSRSSVACIAWYKSAMKPNTKTGKKQVPVVVEKTLDEQLFEVCVQLDELAKKKEELQMAIMMAEQEEQEETQEA